LAASDFGGVWAGLIAGKPAPAELLLITHLELNTETCGSWLASDEARNAKRKYQPLVR
jgi:hypothetical protein